MPANYICRRSYATWDVLLPSPEDAIRLAKADHRGKRIRLQSEYLNKRRTNVTMLNVSVFMEARQVGAILSQYGDVESVTPVRGQRNVITGDHKVKMVLDKTEFHKIPAMMKFDEWTMTIIVEGRRPQCWHCQKQGHMAKNCPKRLPATAPPTSQGMPPTKEPTQTQAAGPPATSTTPAVAGWSTVTKKGRRSKSMPKQTVTQDQPEQTPMDIPAPSSSNKRKLQDSEEENAAEEETAASAVVETSEAAETAEKNTKRRNVSNAEADLPSTPTSKQPEQQPCSIPKPPRIST